MKKEKIILHHSYIEVPNYEFGDCDIIENSMSTWNKIRFERDYIGLFYDEDNRVLKLPRGLDINFIEKKLNRYSIVDKNPNNIEYCNYNLKFKPRDDIQKMSIAFLLGERKYKYTKEHSQLLLELETGFGKTFCTIASLAYMKQKAAVILDELKFVEQWKEKFLEYTDILPEDIYIIKGSNKINNIINSKKKLPYKVYLISNKTLSSFGKRYGYSNINVLFDMLGIGVKVYDEAHICFRNIVKIDCHSNVKKTIYLTATSGRSDYSEDKVFQLAFKNILRFGKEISTSVDRYINSYIFMYNSKPSLHDIAKCNNIYGFNGKAYLDYSLNNKPTLVTLSSDMNIVSYFNLFMKTVGNKKISNNIYSVIDYILNSFHYKEGKIAIMFNKNQQILDFKKYLIDNFKIEEDTIGVFSSIIPDRKKRFSELDKKIILTTDASFGKGTDVKDLRVFVNLTPYRSVILASQFQGRLRYNSKFKSIYIEIVDVGFKSMVNQYQKRKSKLQEKSIIIKEIII